VTANAGTPIMAPAYRQDPEEEMMKRRNFA
jgi:hypothetical protein